MLVVFCDKCGGRAQASTSKMFEGLAQATDGSGLGFEVVLTYAGSPVPDHHLCDDCFAELLVSCARTFAGTATIARHSRFLEQALDHEATAKRLDDKEVRLAALDADLAQKAAAAAEREKKLMARMAANDERVRVAEAQAAATKAGAEARARQAVAEALQVRSDQENDRAYLESTARREALRAEKSKERPAVKPIVIEGEDPAYVEAVRQREAVRASGLRARR
jgi:hypothetical protein